MERLSSFREVCDLAAKSRAGLLVLIIRGGFFQMSEEMDDGMMSLCYVLRLKVRMLETVS